uniref:Uncharacterized protein n=1 Tax=Mola mola TaxID=94237 RepID=A0A3Q3WUR4_MOLML
MLMQRRQAISLKAGNYSQSRFQMVQHLTYCRRLSHNGASNKTRLFQTPGNHIAYLYTKKVLMRLSKTKKDVSSAYRGSMCAKCMRDRISCDLLFSKKCVAQQQMQMSL